MIRHLLRSLAIALLAPIFGVALGVLSASSLGWALALLVCGVAALVIVARLKCAGQGGAGMILPLPAIILEMVALLLGIAAGLGLSTGRFPGQALGYSLLFAGAAWLSAVLTDVFRSRPGGESSD